MTQKVLVFGSEAWRTHMRRSLAQRKRHGENITDIEGLIGYIEKKGPAKKGEINGKEASKVEDEGGRIANSVTKRSTSSSTPSKTKKEVSSSNNRVKEVRQVRPVNKILDNGFYPAPMIHRAER